MGKEGRTTSDDTSIQNRSTSHSVHVVLPLHSANDDGEHPTQLPPRTSTDLKANIHLDAVGPLKHPQSFASSSTLVEKHNASSLPNTDSLSHGSTTTEAQAVSSSSSDAVREDEEGTHAQEKSNHGDGGRSDEDQQRRQSPSPCPSTGTSANEASGSGPTIPTKKTPLVSLLRKFSAYSTPGNAPSSASRKMRSSTGSHTRSGRRIRGLWGDADDQVCLFSQLHDETLLHNILTFLSMKDLCQASMVCQRWNHLARHKDAWKRIDATDFVQTAYDYYSSSSSNTNNSATKATSLVLAARMEQYSPNVISIHSIEHRLSAGNFVSSSPSLQELTLTHFYELTDTHIHALLLSSSFQGGQGAARSNRTCSLRKLVLEVCPLLTDATVQSVSTLCPELEELSLQGNPKIQDLSALAELWTLAKKPKLPPKLAAPNLNLMQLAAPPKSATSVASLFGPPPTAPTTFSAGSSMTSLFSPPPIRPKTPPNALQSLFAPPGQSPPRTSHVINALPRQLTKRNSNNKTNVPGKLSRINVSNTGVTACSLLQSWKIAAAAAVSPAFLPDNSSSYWVKVVELVMNHGTSGASWNDGVLEELGDVLDVGSLKCLEIATDNSSNGTIPFGRGKVVSDKGLRALARTSSAATLLSLKRLDLSGHTTISSTGIADLITSAESTLEELVLDGCKGISAQTKNPASDFVKMDSLTRAIVKCTTRSHNNQQQPQLSSSQPPGGRGLRRLSLARCFSSQIELQQQHSQSKLQHEETLGSYLLEAMGPKQKKKSFYTTSEKPSSTTTLCELDLSHCWFVSTSNVVALQRSCPGLHTIKMEGTRAAQDRS